MTEKQIKLENIEDVKDFVTAATIAPFDMDLSADRYVVDAKSILGIFSLNLANVITLRMYTDDAEQTEGFLRGIDKYLV